MKIPSVMTEILENVNFFHTDADNTAADDDDNGHDNTLTFSSKTAELKM